ncbi:MAG: hypothetical protein H6745_18270 [Deltaproteobacteria bacterium]|nr:hypothetical protein [Deltaproteobacteria bacterium]
MTRRVMKCVIGLALALAGCATSGVVADRGAALEAQLAASEAPAMACAPKGLALARAELAFARDASDRGDGVGASTHLDAAERYGAEALATSAGATCAAAKAPSPPAAAATGAPDGDGDGVPDALDQCLTEREDMDGWVDQDGCPDPDNDGDGINDQIDQCPDEAEDLDGWEDIDGCPEPGGGG